MMSTVSNSSAGNLPHTRADGCSDYSVETFRGTNSELQEFLERVWSDAYSGRMAFPVWSKEYLDWQFAECVGEPDRRLAVYESGQLAAVLLGTPHRFRDAANTYRGAHWSWLTVDAAFRSKGMATALDCGRVALERQAGSDLIVSYRFTGSRHSLAEKPSSRFPLKQFARRVGFWVRPLDMRRLQKWNVNSSEAFFSGLLAPFVRECKSGNGCRLVESMDQRDVNDCLHVLQAQTRNHALSIDWNAQSLRHQLLGNALSQTVVAEHDGRIKGFVNFHVLPFQGRTREPIAIIDLMSLNQLSSGYQKTLLETALANMRQQGAILAMKLRGGDESRLTLLRSGFIPRQPDSSLVLQWTKSARQIHKRKPVHLLWR